MPDYEHASRRSFIGGVVPITLAVTGCMTFGPSPDGGKIFVENGSGGDRTVEVVTSKIHEEFRRPVGTPDGLTPPATHLLQRTETFQVPDGETHSSAELIPEPGTYHIYVSDDRGGEKSAEYGFPGSIEYGMAGSYTAYISVTDADGEPWIGMSLAGSD